MNLHMQVCFLCVHKDREQLLVLLTLVLRQNPLLVPDVHSEVDWLAKPKDFPVPTSLVLDAQTNTSISITSFL